MSVHNSVHDRCSHWCLVGVGVVASLRVRCQTRRASSVRIDCAEIRRPIGYLYEINRDPCNNDKSHLKLKDQHTIFI